MLRAGTLALSRASIHFRGAGNARRLESEARLAKLDKSRTRGLLYSSAGALSAAIYIFPYKHAGTHAPPSSVAWALLLLSALMNSLSAWLEGRSAGSTRHETRVEWRAAVVLAVLAVTGNFASAAALVHLPPAITSVLLRTEVIFVAALGVLFLKERPSLAFYMGAVLALFGLAVMHVDRSAPRSLLGTLWGLGAACSFASMQVLTRSVIHRIRPTYVNAVRLWLATVLLGLVPGAVQGALGAGSRFWGMVTLAALFGPFIGRLCIMLSLRSLAAAESALLLLSSPFLAFLIGYLIFGSQPRAREILGGALMLAGIALPPLSALLLSRPKPEPKIDYLP